MKKSLPNNHFLYWLLFIIFTALYFSSTVGVMNSTDGPQYALTQAMVEEHRLEIDNYSRFINPDYANFNGHKYSIRSPVESVIGIPFYVFAKIISSYAFPPYNWRHHGIDKESALEALTILNNSTFGALSVVLLYILSLMLSKKKVASIIAAFTFGLGTLLWKYSGSYQRHSAIVFLTLAICIFWYVYLKKARLKYVLFLGIVLGIAVSLENLYIALFPLFIIFFWINSLKNKQNKNLKIWVQLAIFTVIFSIFIMPNFIYNRLIFGNFFAHPYSGSIISIYHNPKNIFAAPLFSSLIVNLVNYSNLPKNVIPDFVWGNKKFMDELSAEWAIKKHYRGIMHQSPYLIFSLAGFILLFRRKKLFSSIVFISAIILLLGFSKYTVFFSPNAFDTRYFLPVVALLTIPASIFLVAIFSYRSLIVKIIFCLFCFIFIGLSIYYSLVSVVTNFAPHVTGDNRFLLSYLERPVFAGQNFMKNLNLLAFNAFPNIYNIPLICASYFMPLLLIYLAILNRKFILSKIFQLFKYVTFAKYKKLLRRNQNQHFLKEYEQK